MLTNAHECSVEADKDLLHIIERIQKGSEGAKGVSALALLHLAVWWPFCRELEGADLVSLDLVEQPGHAWNKFARSSSLAA